MSDTNSWVTFALRGNMFHEWASILLWYNIHYINKQIIYMYVCLCITTQPWTNMYFQWLDTTNYYDKCSSLQSYTYNYYIEGREFILVLVFLRTQTKSHSASKFLFYVYVCLFDDKSASPYRIKISFCAWKVCPPWASEQSLPTSKPGPSALRYIYSFVEAIPFLAKVKSLSASNMTTDNRLQLRSDVMNKVQVRVESSVGSD